MKHELFAATLGKVCELAEVSEEEVRGGSRIAEAVDVRHIVVKLLTEQGYYAKDIADYMGMSERNVRRVSSDFDMRVKTCKPMRYLWECVKICFIT